MGVIGNINRNNVLYFYMLYKYEINVIKKYRMWISIKSTYPDNRILWDVIGMSWRLMSYFDIFFGWKRRQSSMEMSWNFDKVQQDFSEKKASP